MIKRLSLLNGLAILAVVCNHATYWGYIALFNWADRYRPVAAPNFDQLGSFGYYVLTAIEKLAVFSVPAFLFFSGFFVAFAARGSQNKLTWKMIRIRIVNLLIPYVIWSIFIFVTDAMEGNRISLVRYGLRLLYGGAIPHYFFIPLLCQFYLLSPFLVSLARSRGTLLLTVTAVIQIGVTAIFYIGLFIHGSLIDAVLGILKYWSWFPMWIFFFAFGIYTGFHLDQIHRFIDCYKWLLLGTAAATGALAVFESNVIYSQTGINWRDTPLTFPSTIYALAFILSFLAFERFTLPFPKVFSQLSSRTYGIYLLHTRVIGYVSRLAYSYTPWILGNLILFIPLLVLAGLGIPYLFMSAVARSPFSKAYRFLFG